MGNTCDGKKRTQDQLTSHSSEAFVITCMDFRLVDDFVRFLDSKGLNNNYDQFVLAGASLGFTQDKYPQWGITLLNHLNIGKELHHFRKIIFIDHRDCGAYKKFYPNLPPGQEENVHKFHMQRAHDLLSTNFGNFEFVGYLMDLQGKCIELPVTRNPNIRVSAKQDPFLSSFHK